MGVKLIGFDKMQMALKKNADLSAAKKVVKYHGSELQKKMVRNAPVDTHNLEESIMLELSDNGLTATSEAQAEYAGYVEYGTRYMDAQPYAKPAFNEQSKAFKTDMQRLVK